MAHGRLILASDIQENLDVLSGHGRTFKSQDVGSLMSKLKQILVLDKHVLRDEGRKTQLFGIENYDWEIISAKVEKLLINLF